MTDRDTIEMMQRCVEEISMLRQVIDTLRPKAEAYESIAAILGLLPQTSRSYGVDIVGMLKKQIAEMQAVPVGLGEA